MKETEYEKIIREQMQGQMGYELKPPELKPLATAIMFFISIVMIVTITIYSSLIFVHYDQVGIIENRKSGEIQEEVLYPGYHHLLFGKLVSKIHKVGNVQIPVGHVGFVKNDAGQILNTLTPGIYQINTKLYAVHVCEKPPRKPQFQNPGLKWKWEE